MTATVQNAEPAQTPVPPATTSVPLADNNQQDNPPQVRIDVDNKKDVESQVNSGSVGNQYNYFDERRRPLVPASKLRKDLSHELPPGLRPFRHPKHDQLLKTLKQRNLLLLISYKDEAGYAAGHALVHDASFNGNRKRTLFLACQRDGERSDPALLSVADDDFLDEPQIFLIGIRDNSTFFDSVLGAAHQTLSHVCKRLKEHHVYIVLSVDEKLLDGTEAIETISGIETCSVSHLHYLLSEAFGDRAADLETRIEAVLGRPSNAAERRKQYQLIADHLVEGPIALEMFLDERDPKCTSELNTNKLPTMGTHAELTNYVSDSDVHRTAAFVAAYFPELHQRDFDQVVRLLLADEGTTKESTRRVYRADGRLVTVHEKTEERFAERWNREADRISNECCLRTVVRGDGSLVIEFSAGNLRDELRAHFEKEHSWYVRRQCERLQNSGALFYDGLSPKAVEGLVQMFVERAIRAPRDFGNSWLCGLVLNENDVHEERLLTDWQERVERMSILLGDMLVHPTLRPIVHRFFDSLIASKHHGAVLDLILDLVPRLRFVPEFDTLAWMKRLLNDASRDVRQRTSLELVELARRSGLKVYEVLAAIHTWLPDIDHAPANFSFSHWFAIQFPFAYCEEMAQWVTPGMWPSQHPLFYALPDTTDEIKKKITPLIEWIVDGRGAALEEADASDPLKSAEAVRIGLVADLVEHWAWVLEGPPSQTPPPKGQALFGIVLEVLNSQLSPRQRTWLQRNWQRRQEEQLNEASTKSGQERKNLIARKTKIEQLRMRYASMAGAQRIPIQGEPAS